MRLRRDGARMWDGRSEEINDDLGDAGLWFMEIAGLE